MMPDRSMGVTFYPEVYVEELAGKLDALKQEVTVLESLRPHWAQGYTSDSLAAQSSIAALSQVWDLLGVDNQTAAMQKLRDLLGVA